MKILLVEDEDLSVVAATRILESVFGSALQLSVAGSRDTAFEFLHTDSFDLIVCDLRIPNVARSLNITEDHGKSVHTLARSLHPGTPLIFLTGFATSRNTKTELASGGLADMYGLINHPVVQLAAKDNPLEYQEYLQTFSNGLEILHSSCEIISDSSELDDISRRAICQYAISIDAYKAEETLFTGKSGARVSKLTYYTRSGTSAAVLLKVANYTKGLAELENYAKYVPNYLNPGFFAPALTPIKHGLRNAIGLLYTLADARGVSLFEALSTDPELAERAVKQLRRGLTAWNSGTESVVYGIGHRRRLGISDEAIADFPLDGNEIRYEDNVVAHRLAIVHGDMHGENILIDSAGRPVLIDFGDTGFGSSVVDPVTLELSILFHENGPARGGSWPTDMQLSNWKNLNEYCAGSPFEGFVRECRSWALSVGSVEAVEATAYAHAKRQLKYSDSNKDQVVLLTQGLAEGH